MMQVGIPVASPAATIGFIDLAGFSAITDVYGDESAVGVLDRFEALVNQSVGESGRVVKWLGDGAMVIFPDPLSAILAMGKFIPACRATPEIPLTRVALHHGPVLERRGDYFGATVNMASRLNAVATPGQMLATELVAKVAASTGVSLEPLGAIPLRSVSKKVLLYSIEIASSVDPDWIDPVCKMLAPYSAFVRQRPDGPWFCSPACADAFRDSPETYLAARAVGIPPQAQEFSIAAGAPSRHNSFVSGAQPVAELEDCGQRVASRPS